MDIFKLGEMIERLFLLTSLCLLTINLGQSLSCTVPMSFKETVRPLNQCSLFSGIDRILVKEFSSESCAFFLRSLSKTLSLKSTLMYSFLVCLAASGPEYHLLLSSVFQMFCHCQRWFLSSRLTTCCVSSRDALRSCSPLFW